MSDLSKRRILVVDDHHIIRAGLINSLLQEGCTEILQADSFRSALTLISQQLISQEQISLILTDQHLGDGEGIELSHIAKQANPEVTLVLFSFEESWSLIERARALGFSLYLSKQSTLATIIQALHETVNESHGGRNSFAIYSPSLPRDSGLISPLTRSELEVLALMSEGLTSKEIASKRFNSEATIKSHTGSILRKLQSRNRVEAIRKARELNLISAI